MGASPRIGIIGAGPGGLSLARILTDRGHADVTVLERAPRVGGKSLTLHVDGVGHEMGTCYTATGYTVVREWMREAGIGEVTLDRHAFRTRAGHWVPFKDYVLGASGALGAAAQAARYAHDWARFHEWDLGGAPDHAEGTAGAPMREEVAAPFRDWLRARGLDVIERFALRTTTIMGYGPLDRVPALYGLRWNMPSLLLAGAISDVGEPTPGWQHLWQHLAARLDVRLGTDVARAAWADDGIRVTTSRGDFTFDHLVLSGPLDEAASFVELPEPWLATEFTWREYVTTLAHVEGWFRDGDTRSFEAHAWDADAVGRSRLLVARRTADKSDVARARSRTRRDLYVCYQAGAEHRTLDELHEVLREDLAAEGATLREVLQTCRWRYAPQLSATDIAAGAVGRFERLQGRDNLWITGAAASHEAVDNIVDYNRRLADRMELAFAGEDPSSKTAFEVLAARYRWSTDEM
ncbi:MAG: FAD-dependent oxidoreductase [Polyangiales bacterium]